MHHLDIDGLATVVAIANRASFSAASRDLGKTQAAVSFIVARLEERLDARLFERSPRGATLTAAGTELVRFSRLILALESEALAAVTRNGVSGRIRLGMPDDYVGGLGGPAVEQFSALWSAVQVDIVCDFSNRLVPMVAAGDLDLAIITRDGRPPAGEALRDEPLVWCTAPDAMPERLEPLPLALFSEQCRARPVILDALERAGRRWRLTTSCSHLQGVLSAVARGRAVTALPSCCVPAHFRRLGPESRLPPLPLMPLALLVPTEARVATRRLAETLRRCFAAPSGADVAREITAAPDAPPPPALPPSAPRAPRRHAQTIDTGARSTMA
jgi:DNA-binding transcriptional LysR family regulator